MTYRPGGSSTTHDGCWGSNLEAHHRGHRPIGDRCRPVDSQKASSGGGPSDSEAQHHAHGHRQPRLRELEQPVASDPPQVVDPSTPSSTGPRRLAEHPAGGHPRWRRRSPHAWSSEINVGWRLATGLGNRDCVNRSSPSRVTWPAMMPGRGALSRSIGTVKSSARLVDEALAGPADAILADLDDQPTAARADDDGAVYKGRGGARLLVDEDAHGEVLGPEPVPTLDSFPGQHERPLPVAKPHHRRMLDVELGGRRHAPCPANYPFDLSRGRSLHDRLLELRAHRPASHRTPLIPCPAGAEEHWPPSALLARPSRHPRPRPAPTWRCPRRSPPSQAPVPPVPGSTAASLGSARRRLRRRPGHRSHRER